MYFGFILEHHPHDCLLWIRQDRRLVCLDRNTAASNDNVAMDFAHQNLGLNTMDAASIKAGRAELLKTLEQSLGKYPREGALKGTGQKETILYRFAVLEQEIIQHISSQLRIIL